MTRIMFVCHGNICRSPMAEFVLKKMVSERGVADQFVIASSATSTEEIWGGVGNPVYPPAKAELARHGISCEGKRAVQLTRADYDKYDLFVGMDSANIRNMNRIADGDPEGKIFKLLSFAGYEKNHQLGAGRDVADPWYTGDFEATYQDVIAGCEGLLQFLKEEGKL